MGLDLFLNKAPSFNHFAPLVDVFLPSRPEDTHHPIDGHLEIFGFLGPSVLLDKSGINVEVLFNSHILICSLSFI